MEAVKIGRDNEFKVKAVKASQTSLSDTNIALPPSLCFPKWHLIMQELPSKYSQQAEYLTSCREQ